MFMLCGFGRGHVPTSTGMHICDGLRLGATETCGRTSQNPEALVGPSTPRLDAENPALL